MDDKDTIIISGTGSSGSGETFVIDLNQTYGATTSYTTDINLGSVDNMSYTIDLNDTITLNNLDNITITGDSGMWWNLNSDTHIEISEVEKMCKEYPALAKVYENFKTVYDLVKQDWKGKKDADETS